MVFIIIHIVADLCDWITASCSRTERKRGKSKLSIAVDSPGAAKYDDPGNSRKMFVNDRLGETGEQKLRVGDEIAPADSAEGVYTNQSFWQMYNRDYSEPFRETNHEPAIWLLRQRFEF